MFLADLNPNELRSSFPVQDFGLKINVLMSWEWYACLSVIVAVAVIWKNADFKPNNKKSKANQA